jgi:ABC-type transport system involved in multi-copper enzyme maturation permease subunit
VPGAIATEVERGTIDFVLSRPIRRSSYILAVTTASLILVTAAHLSALLTTLLARQTISGVHDLSVSGLLRVFFGSWMIFTAVSLVAVLISANSSLRSRAIGLSVGFVVLSLLINVAALGSISSTRCVACLSSTTSKPRRCWTPPPGYEI